MTTRSRDVNADDAPADIRAGPHDLRTAPADTADLRDETVDAKDDAVEAADIAVTAKEGAVDAQAGAVDAREGAVEAAVAAARARDETVQAQDEAAGEFVVSDDDPETLIDERRLPEHPAPFGRPGRPLRRNTPFYWGFVGALGVFIAYVLVQAVANARSVLVIIVVSAFLAVGLNPAVEWLIRRGLHRTASVGVVFAAVIACFVGFGFAVVPPLVAQTNTFIDNAPALLDQLQQSSTIRQLNENYGVVDNAKAYITSGQLGERAFGGIVGVGKVVAGAVFSALSVLILTLYFLASLPSIKRQTYRLVPSSRRERVSLLADAILTRIGSFVSGMLTVAFLAGLSSFGFLSLIGAPYALPLALLVAITDLIPMVGATIGALVVIGVGFTDSVTVGVACIVFYIIYQQVENYLIYPRVMRRAVDVPAPVTVMAALVGGALLGVIGALLAIPIAAAILLLVREVLIPRQERV